MNAREHQGAAEGRYDLAVIGAGSAGFSAAISAAEQGARVALVGHGTIGGTCVNFGCIPSKTMIRAAQALHDVETAPRFAGVDAAGRLKDWNALRAQKDELVSFLRKSKYFDVLSAYEGVAYIEGKARLENGGVTVAGAPIVTEKIIVTTGSQVSVPLLAGIQTVEYLTSTTAFEMTRLPRSLIVMGGGYIGCELAQMFARLGVEVTMVFRSRLLPGAEPEISRALAGVFEDEGISLRRVDGYEHVRTSPHGIALTVTRDGSAETFDAQDMLLATGRTPNTHGLGLAEAGVEVRADGGISIDDRMRTTVPGVYAAGDVTGRDQFVYMAAYGAKIAANNALNGDRHRYDNSAMPAVVFTDPQVASVGLTEAAALRQGIEARTSVLTLDNVPRALAARDCRGLVKLVADCHSGKLIGAHIMAPEGVDSIQTAALAISQGMTYDALAAMVFPYLTTVEGLKLAAQTFDIDVAKLSCCAG